MASKPINYMFIRLPFCTTVLQITIPLDRARLPSLSLHRPKV